MINILTLSVLTTMAMAIIVLLPVIENRVQRIGKEGGPVQICQTSQNGFRCRLEKTSGDENVEQSGIKDQDKSEHFDRQENEISKNDKQVESPANQGRIDDDDFDDEFDEDNDIEGENLDPEEE